MKKLLTLLVCLMCWCAASAAGYAYTIRWYQANNWYYHQDGTEISMLFCRGLNQSLYVTVEPATVDASKVSVYNGKEYRLSVEIADVTIGTRTAKGLKVKCSDLTAGSYMLTLAEGAITFNSPYPDCWNITFEQTMDLAAASNGGGGNPSNNFELTLGAPTFPYFGISEDKSIWGTGFTTPTPNVAATTGEGTATLTNSSNTDCGFIFAPAISTEEDHSGQITFQFDSSLPAGDYTLTIPAGYFKDADDNLNSEASVSFHYEGLPVEYADLDLEASFPWATDASDANYLRLESPSRQSYKSLSTADWYITDIDGNHYSSWKMAPMIPAFSNSFIDMRVPDNLPKDAEYTLMIPQGSVTFTNGDQNNAAEIPFTYGTIGTAEPEAVSLSVYNNNPAISERDGWYEWTVYCMPQVSIRENSGVNITLTSTEDETATYTITPRSLWSYGSYTYVYMPLPAELPTGQYQLTIPEGYFNIANSINYNATNTQRVLDWKNPNDPEPVTEVELEAAVVQIEALNDSNTYEWIDGTTSTSSIRNFKVSLGSYWYEKDRDTSKTITVTDADGNEKSGFFSWAQDSQYNTAFTYEFYSDITEVSTWSITIPAGYFTWENINDEKFTNAELTIENAFQLVSAEKPQVEETEIEFDPDNNYISFFNPTPNVRLYVNATIGTEEDVWCYNPFTINATGDEDGIFEERVFTIRDNVPNGAVMTVYVEASCEGMQSSVTTETYTLVVKQQLQAPTLSLVPAQTGETIMNGTVITITNPNEAGVLKYNTGSGLQSTSEKSVEVTVNGSTGATFEIFAVVAPAEDEEDSYRQSSPVEASWTIDGSTGISGIYDAASDVRVFTLQGIEVKDAKLAKGTYIVVRNGNAEKVTVK